MIMSKEARLCYHAVPRILSSELSPWADKEDLSLISNDDASLRFISDKNLLVSSMNKNYEDSVWTRFQDYVKESRINMNVRQVLNEKQNSLIDSDFNDT